MRYAAARSQFSIRYNAMLKSKLLKFKQKATCSTNEWIAQSLDFDLDRARWECPSITRQSKDM